MQTPEPVLRALSRVSRVDSGTGARQRATRSGCALVVGIVFAVLTGSAPAFASGTAFVAQHPVVDTASDIALVNDPGSPSVRLQATCDSATTETVSASLGGLVVGRPYRAALTVTSTGESVPTVPAQSFVAGAATATLLFTKVPGALDYTVTVADSERSLEAQARIALTVCDLPMLESPPRLDSGPSTGSTGLSQGSTGRVLSSNGQLLAVSVSGTTIAAVVGFGLLLLGLAIAGIELVRRRARGR